MPTKKTQTPDLKELLAQAKSFVQRQKSSTKPLNKAIIKALPPLDINNPASIEVAIQASAIIDSLSELSRRWLISINWLYTVCNPNITNKNNPKYSPVYVDHRTSLPSNQFGELTHVDDDGRNHGDKLVGDDRFANNDFGSAWNDEGFVTKQSSNGHPVLDGFTKLVSNQITKLQDYYLAKPNRDRHFKAFMVSHTRDVTPDTTNNVPQHKPSHVHVVLDLPNQRSRYQIMLAMGFNFDDFIETFKWIVSENDAKRISRIRAFFNILEGGIRNYTQPEDLSSALQYLVHQSKQSIKDQKTPYKTEEVISWLPDDADTDYEHLAGVFNNDIVATGANAAVIANLESKYNRFHQTKLLVGRNKPFSLSDLTEIRNAAKKMPGSLNLTKKSKTAIGDKLMALIRSGSMQVSEWPTAIHAALDDATADSLLSDKTFVDKLNLITKQEVKAIISSPNQDRNMQTIFISAAEGGMGKTRLAKFLSQYYDNGREPHKAASFDKNKTFDSFQGYDGQLSAIMDEIEPSSISINQLKDMLDPHKIPTISSRNVNVTAWNLHHMFLTRASRGGIGDYIRQVMLYAPGVLKEGYLEEDHKGGFTLIKDDPVAVQKYLSGLSQLLRRIPIWLEMKPTADKSGVIVTVYRINFNPSGQSISRYDYVTDKDSHTVFHRVINDSLPDALMEKLAKKVAEKIDGLNRHANQLFKDDPNVILSEDNGFASKNIDLGLEIVQGKLVFKGDHINALFPNNTPSTKPDNLISKLKDLSYAFWDPDEDHPDFDNQIDQLTALLKGFKVPVVRINNGNEYRTIQLTPYALSLIKSGDASEIFVALNESKFAEKNNKLFSVSKTDCISGVKNTNANP